MKALKGMGIAEIVLKVILAPALVFIGLLAMALGGLAVGIGAAFGAAIGGAIGGEEGAEQAAGQVELPPQFLNFFIAMLIVAAVVATVGLVLAILSVALPRKAKDKKSMIPLAILDILFFNPIVGIGLLATKPTAFLTEEQVTEADVEVVDLNTGE
ncbi:MAG: hypothetical protein MJ248_00165 [Bacilli bacterium]|nr:hypothetical protein [Bacilli bacterium]